MTQEMRLLKICEQLKSEWFFNEEKMITLSQRWLAPRRRRKPRKPNKSRRNSLLDGRLSQLWESMHHHFRIASKDQY